ncbi:putative spermidine/putrescine transport system ATP-binding protein [Cryobacterium psychrotolerans]|uniref:Spermidine/putrescine import ATP-binding protein PotA n=1 Tax=Cryobacterium psychrotolerans TaxID=386301 RepID=A0A1G9FPD6_9MICO|nr:MULTISPECIES: ABC transporter ATP-binding protein [Cryobacterium]TFD47132.1 ABC transporter ATP-binding protein [Cryobacterium sp. TMT1-2-1]TFD88725.1 ABC transporter ATP-binding protein [Cryobacterium psychrotolerans]SDK90240.1 putative spermidine/putrescine transport system ATP-binding protein [Cryobacterium psychrotolerans]
MSDSSISQGAAITLNKLTKRYGDATAVDAIDLNAEPGEFLTLLGPSGSGKTTTLNMIAGFVDVTEGEILVDGKPVYALPPHKRNMGMVFQHYALFPHMSVGDNVAYPLRQRRLPKSERGRLVADALNKVGLANLSHRMPRQLSGGQQQRVALARAIVYSPRVLLMDEPLGALDKKLRDSLQLEIKRIHAELGTTFVYVTHDQDEALVLSDRIAVFNQGKIEQVGSAQDLYERPSTIFVAQFVGESSLFHGLAVDHGAGKGVLSSDRTLHAHRGDARTGAPAALVVRPERIRVQSIDGTAPSGNAVRGRILQEIYLGNSRKLEVELGDGSKVLVRESAGDVTANRPGDLVWLTFRAEDAVVLTSNESPDRPQAADDHVPVFASH